MCSQKKKTKKEKKICNYFTFIYFTQFVQFSSVKKTDQSFFIGVAKES